MPPPTRPSDRRDLSVEEAAPNAWRRVVNPRSIAAVFYLSLLFVLARLVMVWHEAEPAQLAFDSVRHLRQTLISGLTVLLAIGLAEAVLGTWRVPAWTALGLRALLIALAAVGSALLRLLVFNGHLNDINRPWFVTTVGVWMLNGAFGHAVFWFAHDEQRMRRRLARAASERDVLVARNLEARLSALQAQIEPHFLFNTLAHVQRLFETEPARGREMLRSLIDYLRAALPSMRGSGSSLQRELELARSYLTILKLRMGERLVFDIRADPALLASAVPPMLLPTLVENAIKHGLAPLPQGGRIDISAERTSDDRLAIEVADTGRGFSAAAGSGVGLSNTRSRLAALFGDQAALELRAGSSAGIVARLVLPLGAPPAPEAVP